MITYREIEVNLKQIKAIHSLHSPWNPKEVQCLTGMTIALNKFISQLANQCRLFFQLLHKWKYFIWTKECDKAFEELKKYLGHPPILSRPGKEEIFYAYVAITTHAVSLVLVWTVEGAQKPIYYVSKSLQEAETRYLPLEKVILAIIHATKSCPTTFRPIQLLFSPNFPCKLYF